MISRGALVVGTGPGVGASIARLLARDGYDVGIVGLDTEVLDRLTSEIRGEGVRALAETADVADPRALADAVTRLSADLGTVNILHFNPSNYRNKSPLSLTVEELLEDVNFGVGALLVAVQAALPKMNPGARITATGSIAADSPSASAPSLGVQKAGLRNLVKSIDECLKEDRIRAVSVTVNGAIHSSDALAPDRIAAAVIAAAHQDEQTWQAHVRYPT
jgi:NADP-dependent 3-hydroxy acid dehydrogenase YdfG